MNTAHADKMDGIYGASDAPGNCTDCGAEWSAGERVHTDDRAGIGGYEDWMYCAACGCEMFFAVVRRPQAAHFQ